MAVQIERYIIGAAAGAQNECVLALPGRAAVEPFGGNDISVEIFQTQQPGLWDSC
jgi:hypothetical protein